MAKREHDPSHEAALRILALLDDNGAESGSVQAIVRAIHTEGFAITMPHSMDVLPSQALVSNAGILGVRVARELEKGNLRGDSLVHDECWNSFIVLRLRIKEAAQMRNELAAMDSEMWTNYTLFHQCAAAIRDHAIQARARSSDTANAFHSLLKRAMEELQLCLTSAFEALRDAASNVMLYVGAAVTIHDVDNAFIMEPFTNATASAASTPNVMTERAALSTLHFPGRGQGPLTLPLHTVRHCIGVLSLRLVDVRAAFAGVTELLRAGPPPSPTKAKQVAAVAAASARVPASPRVSSSLEFGSPGFNPASTLSHQLAGMGRELSTSYEDTEADGGSGIIARLKEIAGAVSSIVDGDGVYEESRAKLASLGEQLSSAAGAIMAGFARRPSSALPRGRVASPARARLPGLLAPTADSAEPLVTTASLQGAATMRSPRYVRREMSRERLASQPARGRMNFSTTDNKARNASRSRSRSQGLSALPRSGVSEAWETVLLTSESCAAAAPLASSRTAYNAMMDTVERGRTPGRNSASARAPASRSNSGSARSRAVTTLPSDQLPFAARLAQTSLSASAHRLGARVVLANASSRLADSTPAWRELWGLPPANNETDDVKPAAMTGPRAAPDAATSASLEAVAADAIAKGASPTSQGRRAWNRLRNVMRAQHSFRAKLMTGQADAEHVEKVFSNSSPRDVSSSTPAVILGNVSPAADAAPVVNINLAASRSPSPARAVEHALPPAVTANAELNLEDLATLPTDYHSPAAATVPPLKRLPFLPASPEPRMVSSPSLRSSQQQHLRQMRASVSSARGRATVAGSPRQPPSSRSDAAPPSSAQLEALLQQIAAQVAVAQPSVVDAILATSGGDNVPKSASDTWRSIGTVATPRGTARSSVKQGDGVPPKTPALTLQRESRVSPRAAEIAGRFIALTGHRVATPGASARGVAPVSRNSFGTSAYSDTARSAATDDISAHMAALASLPLPEDLLVNVRGTVASMPAPTVTVPGKTVDAMALKAEIIQGIAGDWLVDE